MLIPLGILSSSGAAPGDFERIATAFGTGSSAVITFSSIGAEYKHLQIRYIGRTTSAGGGASNMDLNFNSNTSAVYNTHRLDSSGASAGSGSSTSITISSGILRESPTNRTATGIIDIMDYADTAKAKTVNAYHGFSNLSGSIPPGYACITGGLFNDTTAITSITLTAPNNFATLSRFSLYGIKG